MSVYYNSSNIAAILGYNYYTNIEEYINLFIEYLYKNNEELRQNDINGDVIKFCSKKEIIEDKLNKVGVSGDKKKEILDIYTNSDSIKNVEELQSNSNKVANILTEYNLSLDNTNKILPDIKSKLNCSYGINNEDNANKLFTKLTNNKIYESNDKLLKKEYNGFCICGKIDGKTIVENKEYVVEIKNRKSKFFNVIPKYETVQLILYTKLCDNNNICFIQKLANEIQIKYVHDLDPDNKIYNDIVQKLEMYNNLIIKLQKNDEERRKFLSLNNIRMYIYLKNILTFLPFKKM
jgi:hypothetical protein